MRSALAAAACLSVGLAAAPAHAQFAAAVTPPRFEIRVDPGQTARQVLEITHAAAAGVGKYRVYTADWQLEATGALVFLEPLQPDSCRPWVAIERKEVAISAGARVRFRFEVHAPEDAAPRECRFALMVESNPQDVRTSETSSFPMSGRIAVIVYVRVGNTEPALELGPSHVGQLDGRPTPVITIRNVGISTGRVSGILNGIDSDGNTIEFTPEDVPILPEQTREVALMPRTQASGTPAAIGPTRSHMHWPLVMRGTLEYGSSVARRIELERTFFDRLLP